MKRVKNKIIKMIIIRIIINNNNIIDLYDNDEEMRGRGRPLSPRQIISL